MYQMYIGVSQAEKEIKKNYIFLHTKHAYFENFDFFLIRDNFLLLML